jgi:hypothetical protein
MNNKRKRNKQDPDAKMDVHNDATSVYTVCMSEQVVFLKINASEQEIKVAFQRMIERRINQKADA